MAKLAALGSSAERASLEKWAWVQNHRGGFHRSEPVMVQLQDTMKDGGDRAAAACAVSANAETSAVHVGDAESRRQVRSEASGSAPGRRQGRRGLEVQPST